MIVPDLGNVRDELSLLLRKFADRAPPKLLRLVFEMSEDMATEKSSFLDDRFQQNPLKDIVERAVKRGEIAERRLTPRVLRVPLSLVLYDVVLTGRQISDEAITEIVDQVFLPIVTPQGS